MFRISVSCSTRIFRTSYSVASARRSNRSYSRNFGFSFDFRSLLRCNRRDASLPFTAVLVLETPFSYTTRICRCHCHSMPFPQSPPSRSRSRPASMFISIFRESLRSLWEGESCSTVLVYRRSRRHSLHTVVALSMYLEYLDSSHSPYLDALLVLLKKYESNNDSLFYVDGRAPPLEFFAIAIYKFIYSGPLQHVASQLSRLTRSS